jgi:tetratricopeptide (TPR) repeat protein
MSEHARLHNLDLDLNVFEDTYGGCWVDAIGPPGRRTHPVPLHLDSKINMWSDMLEKGLGTAETSEELGRALYDCLFSGKIAPMWDRLRGELAGKTAPRVRLDISHTRLSNLPWELMVPTRGEGFTLLISPCRPIIRCLYDMEAPVGLELPQPLRMLIVTSSPDDALEFDVDRVLAAIHETLTPYISAESLHIDIVRHATRVRLVDELRTGYDIVHYIGRGKFDNDEGGLLLADPAGHDSLLSGRDLGALLVGANTRLLVISACELASVSTLDPRLGVADAALRAGVPAVVAMEGPITDTEAALFSSSFYPALIGGQPLQTCVALGRRRIYAEPELNHDRSEWGDPGPCGSPDGLLPNHMPGEARDFDPMSRTPYPGRPVGAQLPSPWYSDLLQRQVELCRIMEAMAADETKRIVVISGSPGSGSSSLALEAGRCCVDISRKEPGSRRAFAGVVWVARRRPPLSGPLPLQRAVGWDVDEFYQQLSEALPVPGLRQARPEKRAEMVRFALKRGRYLVIIDDFDALRGLSLVQLVDRLPAPTKVIVTIHDPIPEADLRELLVALPIGQLSGGQAADLFRQMAVANGVTEELTDNPRLCAKAGGNPLALRLLAGRLADGEHFMVADAASPDEQDDRSLRRLIRESLGRCGPEETAVLRTVALCSSSPRLAKLAHMLDRSEKEIAGLLARLQRLGLVSMNGDNTVSSSPRIRYETLCDVDDQHAETLIRRAIQKTLEAVERTVRDAGSDQCWHTDAQIRNAIWAAEQAYALRDWAAVLRFRDDLYDVVYRRKLWNEGIRLGKWAYDAADRLGRDAERAWCALIPLARHYLHQGNHQAARLWSEQAFDEFDRLGDGHGVACAKHYWGRAILAMGFAGQARRMFQEGLAREDIHDDMKGRLITALAELAERNGRNQEAWDGYRDALGVFERINYYEGIANTEYRLGSVALDLGHHEDARGHLERSLRLAVSHDLHDRRAMAWKGLADLEESLGRFGTARACLVEAAKTLEPQDSYADLTDIEVKLARITAKLPDDIGSAGGVRLAGDHPGEVGVGGLRLPGIRLRCPAEGCEQVRTAYDYLRDYWPSCPRHRTRMVGIAPTEEPERQHLGYRQRSRRPLQSRRVSARRPHRVSARRRSRQSSTSPPRGAGPRAGHRRGPAC